MHQIDLGKLTKGEVRMLSGHPRGLKAREYFNLDALDAQPEPVSVLAPRDLDTITPSFIQGFLADSLSSLGSESFPSKFDLSQLSSLLREDFRVGMDRLIRQRARRNPLSRPSGERS